MKSGFFLELGAIVKRFGPCLAVDRVDLGVRYGEFLCLLGPSGCGKTTVLRVIAGLERPDSGRVRMEGEDITVLPASRRGIGMVFQSYALFPHLTALENIAYGIRRKDNHSGTNREKLIDIIKLVELEDSTGKYPAQLSGGQQQRVALARALAVSPRILLLDEPLSALDARVRGRLRRDIRALQRLLGITTVMVTHDQEEALTMADRIAVMNRGKIEQVGTPREIYDSPATPFIADFIGSVNFMETPPATVPPERKGGLYAIRPEHIRLGKHETGSPSSGVIADMEFRGPGYRAMVNMENDVDPSRQYMVDIPSSEVQRLNLRTGMKVSLEFPEGRVIFYNDVPAT